MTDTAASSSHHISAVSLHSTDTNIHTSLAAKKRLARRYAKEKRFQYYGLSAILAAFLFLIWLLIIIIGKAYPAFYVYSLHLPATLSQNTIDPQEEGRKAYLSYDYTGWIKRELKNIFPYVEKRKEKRALNKLIASSAGIKLQKSILQDPEFFFRSQETTLLLDDISDLYYKGFVTKTTTQSATGTLTLDVKDGHLITASSSYSDFNAFFDKIYMLLQKDLSNMQQKRTRFKDLIKDTEGQLLNIKNNSSNQQQNLKIRLETYQKRDNKLSADIQKLKTALAHKSPVFALQPSMPSLLVEAGDSVIRVQKNLTRSYSRHSDS